MRYEVLASGLRWRLRDYGGLDAGPWLLTVAAPIKRPYVWDLAPSVSAVRYCLRQGLRVYLLEWTAPSGSNGNAGLAEYAVQGIAEAVAALSREAGGMQLFLMGHSLGGTLAAIYAALGSQSLKGLVLLSAPLCFQPSVSRAARDLRVVEVAGCDAQQRVTLWRGTSTPGSSAGHLTRSPCRAGWSIRCSSGSIARTDCAGNLDISQRTVGPACLRLPTLAVVNTADEIAPLASIKPFFDAMPGADVCVLEFPGEVGVGLQHLGILVGRQAYAQVWPEIISWLKARC